MQVYLYADGGNCWVKVILKEPLTYVQQTAIWRGCVLHDKGILIQWHNTHRGMMVLPEDPSLSMQQVRTYGEMIAQVLEIDQPVYTELLPQSD